MSFIKISESEILAARRIKSFKASEQKTTEGTKRETVLTITKTDNQELTLRGKLADEALAILRLHGF
jgi:hypothetical protein